MKRWVYIASLAGTTLIGTGIGCGFAKNLERTSAGQLLMLLAQATNCWLTVGSNASTSCNVAVSGTVGIGGATPTGSTKLAVNGRISSSVLGVYCGTTASLFTGNIGGYAAAKTQCESTCANTNAHMCTSHEVAISRQLGISFPAQDQWISAFSFVPNSGQSTDDCNGWTTAGAGVNGMIIDVNSRANYITCNQSRALACCL